MTSTPRPTVSTVRTVSLAGVLEALGLGAAVVLALLPLLPVYGQSPGLLVLGAGALTGTLVALLSAWRGWSALVTAAVTVVAFLLVGGPVAAPVTTIAGVVPTATTLLELLRSVGTVWMQVLTLQPPFGRAGTLAAAALLLALVGSLLAVSIALRRRGPAGAWAAVVVPVVAGAGLVLATAETVVPVPVGLALGAGLLVWVAWRRGTLQPRRLVALGAVLAVAGGASAVAGPLLAETQPRLVVRDHVSPPFDPSDLVSPLSGYRAFAKTLLDTPLVAVTGLPAGARVRLATLDAYDGVVWNVSPAGIATGSGAYRRVGERLDPGVTGTRARVDVEVLDLGGIWLPTVGKAERFDLSAGGATLASEELRYNDASGAAVLTGGLPQGLRYSVDVVVPPVPTDTQLSAVTVRELALPPVLAVPDVVGEAASEAVAEATTPSALARALEVKLSGNGWFSDGVSAGAAPSAAGHGANRMSELFEAELMVGDGEQYAAAMALQARGLGLPARVVLGFVPPAAGEAGAGADAAAGDGRIVFTGADVEAWVEVAYSGYGWVAYDPTPDESRTPDLNDEPDDSVPEPQVVQPPPPPVDPVQPPDETSENARDTEGEDQVEEEAGFPIEVLLAVGGGLGLLLLLLAPVLVLGGIKARRRRRRRSAGAPAARVAGGWSEVTDLALDLGTVPSLASTRTESAREMAAGVMALAGTRAPRLARAEAVEPALGTVSVRADALVFGPGEPSPEDVEAFWREVDGARGLVRGVVPWHRRLGATLSLRSLRAARRARRTR